MSTNRIAIPMLFTLAGAACVLPGAELTDTDRAAITAIGDRYLQAAVDGDWAAYASVFADDAAELPPGGWIREGQSAIRSAAEQIAADFTSYNTSNATIAGGGGVAYRWMDYDLTSVAAEGAEPFTYYGKLLTVVKKQPNGSWVMVASMWNSRPPPQGS